MIAICELNKVKGMIVTSVPQITSLLFVNDTNIGEDVYLK